MKVKNIVLIFVGIIANLIFFGVVCPYLISSSDTVSVIIGIGSLSVVILCIALIVNSNVAKFLKKDKKENEEK